MHILHYITLQQQNILPSVRSGANYIEVFLFHYVNVLFLLFFFLFVVCMCALTYDFQIKYTASHTTVGDQKWDTNRLDNSLWYTGVLWLKDISIFVGHLNTIPQRSDTLPQTLQDGRVLCTQLF